MINKLVTTICEMPLEKQTKVITLVKQKLASHHLDDTTCTLTNPLHHWILPPGNLQRVPCISSPEQRVEQRVSNTTKDVAPPPPPLMQITDAPLIMAAPYPTTKRTLRLTKPTHSRVTRNNVPGSVPRITPGVQRRLAPVIPPTPAPTPRQSPCTRQGTTIPTPTHLPRVRSIPIDGGVRHNNIISQEAINFLTECIWANSPDIYCPKNICPKAKPSCLDLKQVACPMVILLWAKP